MDGSDWRLFYEFSQATIAMTANRPPNPIRRSPLAPMLRRNSTPRGRDLATSRSSSAGTNVRIKVLRRDEKNQVKQPIRTKPHAAAKPVWILSLIGGIASEPLGVRTDWRVMIPNVWTTTSTAAQSLGPPARVLDLPFDPAQSGSPDHWLDLNFVTFDHDRAYRKSGRCAQSGPEFIEPSAIRSQVVA